jgi:hypothetical protein
MVLRMAVYTDADANRIARCPLVSIAPLFAAAFLASQYFQLALGFSLLGVLSALAVGSRRSQPATRWEASLTAHRAIAEPRAVE